MNGMPKFGLQRMQMGGLLGVSTPMQRLFRAMRTASADRYPLLICGESGTGKLSLARSIHSMSPSRNSPFVPPNRFMAGPAWLESELFGYENGAFPKASQTKTGILAFAGEGTLFLNEIGEFPLSLQAKLLRVLEENEFSPMGSPRRTPFHARIMAATRHDLAKMVRAGEFDEDLYFRLSQMEIQMPPLRERRSDIPLLIDYFIEKYAAEGSGIEFSEVATECLLRYSWPGNIRELENVVQRAISFATEQIIQACDLALDPEERTGNLFADPGMTEESASEQRVIVHALDQTGGDIFAAADALGVDSPLLYRRLKSYGLLPQAS